MTHASAHCVAPRIPEVQELLFKPDRPREIDRYIDYFGAATDARADDGPDVRDEALLERPA